MQPPVVDYGDAMTYRTGNRGSTGPLMRSGPSFVQAFRNHWREGHEFPLRWHEPERWYRSWVERIPRVNCTCAKEWKALAEKHPIDLATPLAFAVWFWRRHNDVNERLRGISGGHPDVSWNECCDRYSYPAEWRTAVAS